MNYRKSIILVLFALLLFGNVIAQNNPEFTTPLNDTVIVNSGVDYLYTLRIGNKSERLLVTD